MNEITLRHVPVLEIHCVNIVYLLLTMFCLFIKQYKTFSNITTLGAEEMVQRVKPLTCNLTAA